MAGFWRRTAAYLGLAGEATTVSAEAAPGDSFEAVGLDAAIARAASAYAETGPRAYSAPVTREFALGVPAVLRGRNIICAIATLPLRHYNVTTRQVARSTLLEQIDPDVPNLVTLAQTVEDLLFEGVAWWQILATGAGDFPSSARHLEPHRVTLDPPHGKAAQSLPSGVDVRSVVWIDGKPVSKTLVIRFDSPNPPLLKAGCRAIRRAALLDATAAMYAENPRPLEYFTPAEDADPDETEVTQTLNDYRTARQTRGYAYIPGALERHEAGSTSPADLQLAQLQARASLDVANAMGLDPEELGVSTTSRTYANVTDRRRDRINDTLAAYMLAITARLSMNDVTRRGWAADFELDDYLKADPRTRAEVQAIYIDKGVIDAAEVREDEGLPPRGEESASRLAKQRDVAETLQKVYLAVGNTITAAEARAIANKAGADLAIPGPFPDPADAPSDQPAAAQDSAAAATRRDVIPMHRALPSAATFTVAAPEAPPRAGATTDAPRRVTFAVDAARADFKVDLEKRTITGLAVPYGEVTSDWRAISFAPGSITPHTAPEPVLISHHGTPLGVVASTTESETGQTVTLRISKTQAGDEALILADDKAITGLSVGVDIHTYEVDTETEQLTVTSATRREVSLTPFPAFDSARINKVQMTRQEHTAMSDTIAATGAAAAAPAAQPEPTPAQFSTQANAAPEPQAPAVRHLTLDEVRDVMRAELAAVREQAEERAFVDPDRRPTTVALESVREALPYRFARGGNLVDGEHSFSADLVAMSQARDESGDSTDAGRRVMSMLREQFAVSTGNVDELNPTIQRPEMYVDQQDYRTPLWDLVNKGGLPNGVQPFTFPKFSSSSGLIGDHTEGTEPTAGTFVTTGQTVNPTALSGLADINREVWDMGGSPAASGLIWAQMVRGWREGLESATATFLNTLTAATDIALTTAGADDALAGEWDAAVADLQFVRGYDFSACALEKVLYKKFVAAVDSTGRKLFPILAPQNANGTASPRFRQLDLSGVIGVPSWALASTAGAANNSWLFDPMYVHGWADAPQRLDFQVRVKSVDIGIWSYKAFANSDIAAVRQITYDSVA